MYMIFKNIHMLMALISVLGFITRSGLKFTNSPILDAKLVKVLPHIVDTLLLISALILAVHFISATGLQAWIIAKFLGLIAYITFGVGVMRLAKTNGERLMYFVAAILTVVYVISVAFTKSPFIV